MEILNFRFGCFENVWRSYRRQRYLFLQRVLFELGRSCGHYCGQCHRPQAPLVRSTSPVWPMPSSTLWHLSSTGAMSRPKHLRKSSIRETRAAKVGVTSDRDNYIPGPSRDSGNSRSPNCTSVYGGNLVDGTSGQTRYEKIETWSLKVDLTLSNIYTWWNKFISPPVNDSLLVEKLMMASSCR